MEVLLQGDDGYAPAREASLANRRRPSRHPEAIVQARSAADVVAAVRLARDPDGLPAAYNITAPTAWE